MTTTSIPTGQETHTTTMEAAVVTGTPRVMPLMDIIMLMTTGAAVV